MFFRTKSPDICAIKTIAKVFETISPAWIPHTDRLHRSPLAAPSHSAGSDDETYTSSCRHGRTSTAATATATATAAWCLVPCGLTCGPTPIQGILIPVPVLYLYEDNWYSLLPGVLMLNKTYGSMKMVQESLFLMLVFQNK